jgi:alpha-tubulin suppressor-like RCC1 family protein
MPTTGYFTIDGHAYNYHALILPATSTGRFTTTLDGVGLESTQTIELSEDGPPVPLSYKYIEYIVDVSPQIEIPIGLYQQMDAFLAYSAERLPASRRLKSPPAKKDKKNTAPAAISSESSFSHVAIDSSDVIFSSEADSTAPALQTMALTDPVHEFFDGVHLDGTWYFSSWFGYYSMDAGGSFIYHNTFGWLSVSLITDGTATGQWLFSQQLRWMFIFKPADPSTAGGFSLSFDSMPIGFKSAFYQNSNNQLRWFHLWDQGYWVSIPNKDPATEPDFDTDGLGDWWEMDYFGNLTPLPGDNDDGDYTSNIEEFEYGLDPNIDESADGNSDGDLLGDRAELALGLSPHDSSDAVDADSDGIVDAIERLYGLSTSGTTDLDGDSMHDEWELKYYLDITIDDSSLDPDGDGLTHLQEFNEGTNPWAFDTDGDTIPDGIEVSNSLDPLTADPIHTRNNYAWQFTTDLTDRFSEFSDRISESSTHALALDENGNVYAWGTNDFGQLAMGSNSPVGTDIANPTLSEFASSKSVAAGKNTSHVVNIAGTVEASGSEYYGILGNGSAPTIEGDYENFPVSVGGLSDVKRIYAQSSLSFPETREAIVGTNAQIYAWGYLFASNYSGSNIASSPEGPKKGLQDLAALSLSWEQTSTGPTAGLLQNGDLKSWGINIDHVLARSGSISYQTSKSGSQSISEVGSTSYVSTKASHGASVSNNGELWVWGKYNGLNRFAVNEGQSSPTQITTDYPVQGVAIPQVEDLGVDYAHSPLYFINSRGDLFVLSWVVSSETLTVSNSQITHTGEHVLTRIPANEKFVGIAEGYDSIYLLTVSGSLLQFKGGTKTYTFEQEQISQFGTFYVTQSAQTSTGSGEFSSVQISDFYNLLDSNNDGLSDLYARFVGLNPSLIDTNLDGVSDIVALTSGADPTAWDNDGDTIPNAVEIARGLNPNAKDSDGDGMLDSEELYLIDRFSNYILQSDADSQGPTINLAAPTNATAL